MKKLLFLMLLPVFGLLFSNNSFALQHNYTSYMSGTLIRPPLAEYQDNLGHYYYNFDSDYVDLESSTSAPNAGEYDSAIKIRFQGSAWDDSYSNLRLYDSSNRYYLDYHFTDFTLGSHNNLTTCDVVPRNVPVGRTGFNTDYSYGYSFSSVLYKPGVNTFSTSTLNVGSGRPYFPDGFNPTYDSYSNTAVAPCYSRDNDLLYYYDPLDTKYIFHYFSLEDGWYKNIRQTVVTNDNPVTMKPSQSYGLALNDSAVSSVTGVTYKGSFDFNKIFTNHYIDKFSYLEINLDSWDGYFLKPENLYQGRQVEWKFMFKFNGSFDWNPNVQTNNSYIRLYLDRAYTDTNSQDINYNFVDCTANLTVTNAPNDYGDNGEIKLLEVSCPITYHYNYIGFSPKLIIQGGTYQNPEYVWTTDSVWQFYSSYFVTDGDYTRGDSFNTDYGQPMWSILNGEGGDGSNEPQADWFSSLSNLFSFVIPVPNTPIGMIFNQFTNTDQSGSCASIPIIAGMLSTTNTTVCPFFPVSVRSVLTPVFALASSLLVFGFIMRWLSSSSGNFILDSKEDKK